MNPTKNASILTFICSVLLVSVTWADGVLRPDSHAPIGLMGDHIHEQGEWMMSYRFMTMDMKDNLSGDNSISSDAIVTGLANPFAPPPTVRVVPIDMSVDMHMLGIMYAPTDSVTLMAMLNYVEKEMLHQTYMGMMGTNQLGQFTTKASGVGDTKFSALVGLLDGGMHSVHLNVGVSLPTGSTDESGQVLSPMNTQPLLRLPYAMQLGSGTYDLEPGVTYKGFSGLTAWGAQLKGVYRLSENDENYSLGDQIELNGWASYRFQNWLSGSLRLTYMDVDKISGRDTNIAAPVQTANPQNYGGERTDLSVGFNTVSHSGHRFNVEYTKPIEQDVNGVQMEMQDMLTLGYQFAF